MKKLLVVLGAVLFASFFFTSCGGKKAADIKVDELKEACDFAGAMLTCTEEMKTILEDNIDKKEADISDDVKKQAEEIEKKMDEIQKAMVDKKISEEDVKKCDEYKKIEEIEKEVKDMITKKMEEETSK